MHWDGYALSRVGFALDSDAACFNLCGVAIGRAPKRGRTVVGKGGLASPPPEVEEMNLCAVGGTDGQRAVNSNIKKKQQQYISDSDHSFKIVSY